MKITYIPKRITRFKYLPKQIKQEIRDTFLFTIYTTGFIVAGMIVYSPYLVFIQIPETIAFLLKRGYVYVKEKFIYYIGC